MGIFNKTTKKVDTKKNKVSVLPKKVETTDHVGVKIATTDHSSFVLLSPRVSEKAAMLAAKGSYIFNVPTSAGKIEIRKGIEALYKVHVERVNTIRGIGKVVRRGRIEGRRNNWKKAVVTLKAGEKLDLYSSV
jgi:large subunit ribosomal protein L23